MRTRTLNGICKYLAVLTAVTVLSGCVIIPTKAPVRQFEEPAISFLAPGHTTQADVRRILGPPVVTTVDDSRWIYHERGMSREYIMIIGWSADMMDATPVQYFLLVNFDENGTLTGYDVEKNGTSCGDGICVARGQYYSIEAEPDETVTAAQRASADQCSVHVFADRPRIGAWIGGDSVEASIDGEQIGYLLDDDTFYRVSVDSGRHELQTRYITNERGIAGLPKPIRSEETLELQQQTFDCAGGEAHYFEHVTDRKTGSRLLEHDEEHGANEIDKRNLLHRLVYTPAAADEAAPTD